MAGGGSKPGHRRGGRAPGTPNKPKAETALIVLDKAEAEVRVLVMKGEGITALGKDRLAQLDAWAYGMAQKFAPKEDEKGRAYWDNDGDEARHMRFLNFCGRCATARAQFESPKYAAIAVAHQGEKVPDIYKRDPIKVMDDIIARWIAAEEAEKAAQAIDVTPAPEPESVEVKPNPDDASANKVRSAIGYLTKQRWPQAAWRTPYSRQRGDWVLGKRYRITRNLLSDAAAAIAPPRAGDLNSSPRAA